MKQDPYAGLDQRLFQEEPQPDKETSKLGNKHGSGPADREASMPTIIESRNQSSTAESKDATGAGVKQAELQTSPQAAIKTSRTQESRSSGHAKPVRLETRHTYDIFQDQVRWMNRVKLDVEDNYDEKVTINGIVKLALDLLREDFDANGEDSNLMRVLVFDGVIRLQGVLRKVKEASG